MSVFSIGAAWRTYKTLEHNNLELNEHIPSDTRIRIAIATLFNPAIEHTILSFDREIIEPINGFAEILSTYPEGEYDSDEYDPVKYVNSGIPWNVPNLGAMASNQALLDIAGYVVAKCEGNEEFLEVYKGRLLFDIILCPIDWKFAWKSFIDTNYKLKLDSEEREKLESAITSCTHVIQPTNIAEMFATANENILINHLPGVSKRVKYSENWSD